jgi:hypothetical protein
MQVSFLVNHANLTLHKYNIYNAFVGYGVCVVEYQYVQNVIT